MWPFKNKKKPPPSRLESRKGAAANGRRRWRAFREAGGVGSVLLAAALFAAAVVMDVSPLEPLPYRLGGYVPRDIYARVDFEVVSEERTREEQDKAAKLAPAVIEFQAPVLSRIMADLAKLAKIPVTTTRPADLPEDYRKPFAISSPEDLAALGQLARPDQAKAYTRAVAELGSDLQTRF
ncbi:MAG: hypothetical protein ACYS5V_00695, partial [Planctomycetota bacterium]